MLKPNRRQDIVDAVDLDESAETDPEEELINHFARDLLLPPDEYARFVEKGDFTREAVRLFAQAQDVAAGIVVGRLQRDKKIAPEQLNDLKQRISITR